MKNFIITSISLVLLTFLFVDISKHNKRSYVPIEERILEPTKGSKDAFEYLHRLKANENGEIPIEAVIKAREQVEARKGADQVQQILHYFGQKWVLIMLEVELVLY